MDLSQAMKRARARTERQVSTTTAIAIPRSLPTSPLPLQLVIPGAPESPLNSRDSTQTASTSDQSQNYRPKTQSDMQQRTSPSPSPTSRTRLEEMRESHQQERQSEAEDLAGGIDESLAQVDLLLKQLKTLVKVSKHAAAAKEQTEPEPSTVSRISKAPSLTSRVLSALIPNQKNRLKILVENGLRSSSPEHSETRLELALKALGIEKGREYAVHSLEQAVKKLSQDDHPWSVIMDEMNKEMSIAESVVDPIHSSVGGIQSSVEG